MDAPERAAVRSGALTRDEARRRAALVSDLEYTVALDLTVGEDVFGCDATLTFRCAEPGATTFVDLTAPSVERIELNGDALPLDAFDGRRIALTGLAAENTLRVVATCAFSHDGNGMHRFTDPVDGAVYCYTDFEPREANRVYPCFDQPDCKGTFAFTVVAPAGWEIVSNRSPVERPAEGAVGRWVFPRTKPMPTYITNVCAGPWHVVRNRHRDIPLGIFCRQSLAQYLDPDEIFAVTKQGFDFFERLFDYPYAFGKYDQVFVPEFNSGAMENAGAVTHNENMIFRSRVTEAAREGRAQTVLHEMAHMWFGDLTTMRWWDDLWLNESFATFMGHLSQERATRFTNSWTTFAKGYKLWAYVQDQLPTTHPIVADVPDTESARTNFDGISYAKGASVLKQLVAWVGEDAFVAGVRAYFRRHEFANADLVAFLGALEEASGRDLSAWSKEWLETAGVNTLRARSTTGPGGDTYATVSVEQSASDGQPALRSHRIAIGLYDLRDGALVRRRRVETDVAGPSTPIPELAGERIPDLLLLNDDDLTYAKIRLDERSLATITEHLAALKDPLARTLCWSAAIDQVRDAEMPARRFLRLVLDNVHTETDIGVVQSLVNQASTAIDLYGDPDNRSAARRALAARAFRALREAEPGSDFQLAWARAFIVSTRDEEHLALLRGLLDGSTTFEGLTVDTDLRWLIVQALCAQGTATPPDATAPQGARATQDAGAARGTAPSSDAGMARAATPEDLVRDELERDPTDAGRRHAAAARALRPTPEAKAEAWEALMDPATPLAMMRAHVQGFGRHEQAHLVEPYVEKYFEALGPVWRSRDVEVGIFFASAAYPSVLIGEEIIRRTDGYLTTESPPPPVARYLVEHRDRRRRPRRLRDPRRPLDRLGIKQRRPRVFRNAEAGVT